MWNESRTRCTTPIGEGERHFLPMVLGAVSALAPLLGGGGGRRRPRPTGPPAPGVRGLITRAVGGGLPGAMGGRRRRRRASLTASEMSKLIFMSQVLGKRSPALTMMVLKSLSGRL